MAKKSESRADVMIDWRAKTADELQDALLQAKKTQFNLRFQAAHGQLENTHLMRAERRKVALIKTLLRERARAAAGGEA